ncbi:MAG: LysM peptidoglycan-binding domain-containing protein [Alphaproteobacteria bacterium]|nr:LysM peptidoglycan-binding domain-containing protein [Alphaproteobacteria bacterium SS10]
MADPMRSSSGLRMEPADTRRSFLLPAIVLVVLVLVGVGIFLSVMPVRDDPLPQQPRVSAPIDDGQTPTLETPSDVASPASLAIEPPAAVAPSFDIVQVDRDGQTVAAGRAEPGATVMIYRNGSVVAEVLADNRGEWVWTPADPMPSGNQVLQLRVNQENGDILASQPIVVLGAQDAVEVAELNAGEEPITGDAERAIIALGDAEGETLPSILQSPNGGAADTNTDTSEVTPLSLGTVRYGAERPVEMTGTGPAGSALTIRLDDELLGQVLVDGDGSWQFESSVLIAPGDHEVVLELPNQAPEAFPFNIGDVPEAQAVADEAGGEVGRSGDRLVIIERGNNLWRIAEATYGSGFRYTVIFEANREKITNPDLIFPGQVFILPVVQ